ncbi:MAG TPA: tetratricopeptide repeat protein, partial [Chloroflexota bacterium]
MSFGQRLRALRRDHDLSQADLADHAACSVNTVRKLEADQRRPSRDLAVRLASVFELPQRERADFLRLARGTQAMGRPNLPSPMTRLVGREQDVAAISAALLRPEVRLLTLVGPPGVGKTRLALQVATELQEAFRDGAAFVPLAAVHEPPRVIDAVATAFDVRGAASRSMEQSLADQLRERQLLLVLDNFEQVLAAREWLPGLLAEAPRLKLLVTSRENLDLYGEQIYRVPTLGLPSAEPRAAARMAPSASERLFLERARAVRPGFATSPADQAIVADICIGLEGLPLALELAASRARSMGPRLLRDELSRRLDLLSAGPSDFTARQRSIRGALDWSYRLLEAEDRRLFERLALFVGGAGLDAVVAVCEGLSLPQARLRQGVESLVEKSLVTFSEPAESTRFGMLEVIREFALERLLASEGDGHVDHLRQRHAEFFASLADEVPEGLRGSDQVRWVERVQVEHHNFRAALDWSLRNQDGTLAGRLAAGLSPFWRGRGYFHEGRRWLDATLRLGERVPDASRASVLNGAGALAILQADYQVATVLLDESLELWRRLDDQSGVAYALSNLGWAAYERADAAKAESLFEESLTIRRALGETWGEAVSITNLGMIAVSRDDPSDAVERFGQSVALFRRVGDLLSLSQALANQGWATQLLGDYARASDLFAEGLRVAQRVQDARGVANNLVNLALMALYRGDYVAARDLYVESFSLLRELGDKRGVAESLEGLAAVAGVQNRPLDAARLFGL